MKKLHLIIFSSLFILFSASMVFQNKALLGIVVSPWHTFVLLAGLLVHNLKYRGDTCEVCSTEYERDWNLKNKLTRINLVELVDKWKIKNPPKIDGGLKICEVCKNEL